MDTEHCEAAECLQHRDGAEDVVHDFIWHEEHTDREQADEYAARCVEEYRRCVLAARLAKLELKVVSRLAQRAVAAGIARGALGELAAETSLRRQARPHPVIELRRIPKPTDRPLCAITM